MKHHEIKWWGACSLTLFTFLGLVVVQTESQKEERKITVSTGKEVSIEYTRRLEDKEVKIITDYDGRSKGFGFVEMASKEGAQEVIR